MVWLLIFDAVLRFILLLLFILGIDRFQLFPSVLTCIKIMTEFLKIRDLPQLQAIHFPFNIVQDPQIVLMRFFIFHHRFSNILYLFKSQSLTFLIAYTLTIVGVMVQQ